MTPIEKLLSHVEIDEPTGCWRYCGPLDRGGYGRFGNVGAHRVAFEIWVGEIPAGFHVDHVHDRGCRHRNCVNPDHLEAVTPSENLRRMHRAKPGARQGGLGSEVKFRMSRDQVARIDTIAQRQGLTRSEVVRRFLDQTLKTQPALNTTRRHSQATR